MKAVVEEYEPVQCLGDEISGLEVRLSEKRLELAKAKVAKKHLDASKEVRNEVDETVEQMRDEKYNQNEKNLIVQWNKNNINWPRFVDAYQFDNKKEAREWLRQKLTEAGKI